MILSTLGCLVPGGVCSRGVSAPMGVCSRGGAVCSRGGLSAPRGDLLTGGGVPGGDPPVKVTAVGCRHPTGMHSCFIFFLLVL